MPTTPRLEFAWTPLEAARHAGIEDLTALEWEEIEHHQDVSPLDVDLAGYRELERIGRLRIGLLRRDGELIGCVIFLINQPLHHRRTTWAVCDAIYVLPEHRRGWAGVHLVKAACAGLKADGVKIVLIAEKPDRNLDPRSGRARLGRLLQLMGFGAYEHVWSKVL